MQVGGAWYSVIKFRQKAAWNGTAAGSGQPGSLPRYAAVSTRDDDAAVPLQHQPISRNGSFTGFKPGSQHSPAQSLHAMARQQMQLQQQQQLVQQPQGLELLEVPSGVLIGRGAGGFSPRKLQHHWGGAGGTQLGDGATELAAGGLADGSARRSPNVSRRNSVS